MPWNSQFRNVVHAIEKIILSMQQILPKPDEKSKDPQIQMLKYPFYELLQEPLRDGIPSLTIALV